MPVSSSTAVKTSGQLITAPWSPTQCTAASAMRRSCRPPNTLMRGRNALQRMHDSMVFGLPSVSLCLAGQAAQPLLMLVAGSASCMTGSAGRHSARQPSELTRDHVQDTAVSGPHPDPGHGWRRVAEHTAAQPALGMLHSSPRHRLQPAVTARWPLGQADAEFIGDVSMPGFGMSIIDALHCPGSHHRDNAT